MRIKCKKYRLLLWVLLLPVTALSQDVLTLEEAMKIALEKNHGIIVARNQVEVAENSAHPGNTGLLPQVTAQGGYNYANQNTDLEFAGGIPPSEEDNAEATTLSASVGVSYTLFDGLGTINNYKKLKGYVDLSETQSRLQIESTILQVVNLYYNMARLQQNLGISREALQISQERYERAQARNKYGGPKILVLNAQVDMNTDSSQIMNLKLNLKNARRNLNVLLGRQAGTEFMVDTAVNYNESLALDELKKRAGQNNAALLVASHNLFISEVDLKLAQSSYYPRVMANASYGYQKTENDAGILLKQEQLGFSGGITLSYSLFDGRRRNIQVQNAKIAIENSQENYEQAQLNVEKDVLNAFENYSHYKQLLNMEQSNLETAQLNFQRTQDLYQLGQVSGTQFREAQLNLIRAKNRITDLQFSIKLAEIELLNLSGQLLE